MRFLIKFIISFIFLVMFIDAAVAEGPGDGTMSKARVPVQGSSCILSNVTVKWHLDSLLGEPTTRGIYKYGGISGCEKLHYSTVLWLEIREKNGEGKGYIKANPVVPEKAEKWSFETISSSPYWNETVCGFKGNKKINCFSKKHAILFWKNGYVSDFHFGADALYDEAKAEERKRIKQNREKY